MTNTVTRAELKKKAKDRMRGHYGTAFKLNSVSLILIILTIAALLILGGISYARYPEIFSNSKITGSYQSGNNSSMFSAGFGGLISTLLSTGIMVGSLTWIRQDADEPLTEPFKRQFLGFTMQFLPAVIVIYILTTIITSIGYLLFIIPGFVLTLAYQLIYLLYSDEKDNYSYFGIIGASWRLMRGHKMDLFVFELSFFFWYIGVICTAGLLSLYFTPYHNLALAAFYDNIYQNRAQEII